MKVKYWMTKDPVTIGPDEPIADAARLMKEHGFRRLPVMERGRLVGLVTYRNILEAQPSAVSTLSRQEARYLLTKATVREVMRRDPVTVSPEDDALTALMEGNRLGLGCYPVLHEEHLVGIITATDLFRLIVQILGADDQADRVYLTAGGTAADDPGHLPRLVNLLADHNIGLLSFMTFPCKEIRPAEAGPITFLKISPGRRREAVELLSAAGYAVLS